MAEDKVWTIKIEPGQPLYRVPDLPYLVGGGVNPPVTSSGISTPRNVGESPKDYLNRLVGNLDADTGEWYLTLQAPNDWYQKAANQQIASLNTMTVPNLERILNCILFDYCPTDCDYSKAVAKITASIEIDPKQTSKIALKFGDSTLKDLIPESFSGFAFEICTWDLTRVVVCYYRGNFYWQSYEHLNGDTGHGYSYLNPRFNFLELLGSNVIS